MSQLKTGAMTAVAGNQGVAPISEDIEVIVIESSPATKGGITLFSGHPGRSLIVVNNSGVTINVWPATGGYIGDGAQNAALTVKAVTGRGIHFTCYTPDKWAHTDVQWG